MFQRKANYKPAALGDGQISPMKLVTFLKAAKEDHQRRGKEDEAFVLEMLEDHFRNGNSPTYTSKIFGF